MSFLTQSLIFLTAALIAVPLSRRAGMSAVLGYLLAGVLIGPSALGLIADVEATLNFAEIGVVLLLFIIGVELSPRRLSLMRRLVFGLGSVQLAATTAVLAALLLVLSDLSPAAALLLGFAFALSSTAFGLQFLAERKALAHPHGRAAFGVLLMQDLAAIPALGAIAMLTAAQRTPGLYDLLVIVGLAAGVFVARAALRPLLRAIAGTQIPEIFTALSLAIVIGASLAFEVAGLSAGLGAFIAGILVADSEYRHQLQTDIAPFKGLLLGLFFIAVGMSANLGLVVERPLDVLGMVAALIAVKVLVLYAVSGRFVAAAGERLRLAVALSQGGEFAFVLLAAGAQGALIPEEVAAEAVLIVTISMALTPLLAFAVERALDRGDTAAPRAPDVIDPRDHHVVIAGFGRFGQIVARVLLTRGVPFTALDSNPDQVDLLRRTGNEVFYGDASRIELLRSAHVEQARVFVIAVGTEEAANRIAETARLHFPGVRLLARALNRQHALRLRAIGVHFVIRDTLLSSIALAREALAMLGWDDAEVARTIERFTQHDHDVLERQFAVFQDESKYLDVAREATRELGTLFDEDARMAGRSGRGPAP